MPKKKAEYGHYPVFMPKNEVHDKVGQLQTGSQGVGQHNPEREKKAENVWAQ